MYQKLQNVHSYNNNDNILIELDSIFGITFYNTNTCRGVYFGPHLVYKGEQANKIGDAQILAHGHLLSNDMLI